MIPSPDYIRAIAPYVPGKPIEEVARELGLDPSTIVKLASNESPMGVSAKVRAAIEAELADLTRYPDGSGYELKAFISKRLGVAPDQVLIGNGSNDVLELAAQATLAPGLASVMSQHAFAVYPLATQARGARTIAVPAKNFGHDLAAMRAAITPDTRIVWVANPNNPTGTWLSPQAVEEFIASVPSDVLVVLDEAYNEFLRPEERADAIAWTRRYPNLLVSRTLSKVYGLAGLRVGYAVGAPEVIALMDRVRQPFNVNSLAQAAAVAALQDDEYVAKSVANNSAGMKQIAEGATKLGLNHIPSRGNFVCVEVGRDAAHTAAINQALLKQGVIVRPVTGYGMPKHLRVSIGLPHENARFLEALGVALKHNP